MKRMIFLATFYCLPPIFALGQDTQTTHWQGVLSVGDKALNLKIKLSVDGDKVTGDFLSPDQTLQKFPMKKIEFADEGLNFIVPQLGVKYVGEFKNEGKTIEGTFFQNGQEFPLQWKKTETANAATKVEESTFELTEAWVGRLEMGVLRPVMQFRIGTDENGKIVAFFDSVTEGRTDFPAEYSNANGRLRFSVASIGLDFDGKLNDKGDQAVGKWKQGGREFELTLKRQNEHFDVGNKTWEHRPQRPKAPFPYVAEEVKFENRTDQITLAGTLTIPKSEKECPAVVLISGSGPQDRDESLMEHKPFLVLADYLSRRGIAVLRYDDRGTAQSTGSFSGATSVDFANDAAAAVEFLKSHPKIAENQIGLVGHSEGGLIAPIVANQRTDVAFVVLLAAPGVVGSEISTSQVEAILRAAGMDEAEIAIEVATTRAIIDTVAKHGGSEEFSTHLNAAIDAVIEQLPKEQQDAKGKLIRKAVESQSSQFQSAWMRFFVSYDPAPALRKLECPALAIIGANDLQVLPELNMPAIESALQASTTGGHKTMVLKGLNHLFQMSTTGSPDEYQQIDETFNANALKAIGDWIRDQTK